MALSFVTVRARTRGKSPVEFTYQGIGKPVARKVVGKGGKAIKKADGSDLMVDDLDVSGFVDADDLDNVIEVCGGMVPMFEYALVGLNAHNRDEASPVVEATASTDELTDMVTAMIAANIIGADDVTVWRRSITSGAQVQGVGRYSFAVTSKHGKKLVKTGWTPNPDQLDDEDEDE